jgi:hypothetical protein
MTEPNSDHLTSASSEGEPGEALALLNLIDEHGAARWKTGFLEARRERSSAAAADKLATNIRREIEQILAAWNRRAPAVPPNWQDIATLPTTISKTTGERWSKWVLVLSGNATYQAMLADGMWSVVDPRYLATEPPSKWMPLPPPPEAASQPAQGDAA